MEEKTIYGDGTHTVTVADFVTFSDGVSAVSLSRAAFREVALAWERLLAMEEEGDR
jgi:hypothetical protein